MLHLNSQRKLPDLSNSLLISNSVLTKMEGTRWYRGDDLLVPELQVILSVVIVAKSELSPAK